jgi:hypothetical protein
MARQEGELSFHLRSDSEPLFSSLPSAALVPVGFVEKREAA